MEIQSWHRHCNLDKYYKKGRNSDLFYLHLLHPGFSPWKGVNKHHHYDGTKALN